VGGISAIESLLIVLFAINFAWIALSFWTALPGFVTLLFRLGQPGLAWPTAEQRLGPLPWRTAVLMPVYNEETSGTIANLQAIYESVRRTGHLAAFDFFILSDSTDPDRWVAEELAWSAFCGRVGGHGHIFYRKRRHNVAKKAGNIADFCRRWGARYDYMVVLDADSLMTGDTLVEMTRLMDANPRAGIIQAPPLVVNRNTLWARMQQFAGRLYGPIVSAGLAFWQLGDGNYWGHNAIIRTRAFIESCGLPVLSGPPPFGGHILSHDFVEAALILRNGWTAWLVPELGGSYEECPPTMIDHAKRDRRWCQGNMQHLRVLIARGLHPLSRLHMAMGVMSYASSPFWLIFICVGMLAALEQRLDVPVYFPSEPTLFPIWPVPDRELAFRLLIVSFTMLLAPKIFGWILLFFDRRTARGFGGIVGALGSLLFETLFSIFQAPVMMLFHSGFVLSALLGRDTGWGTQSRDDRGTPWSDAIRMHRGHTLFGLVLAGLAFWVSPVMLAWLSPLVVGLLLSIPLSVLTSRQSAGLWARRRGLLLTPEESSPPNVVTEANALSAQLRDSDPEPKDGLARVIADPLANAIHAALLPDTGDTEIDLGLRQRAIAKLAITSAGSVRTDGLSKAEKMGLLFDAGALSELHLFVLRRAGAARPGTAADAKLR
jgi:membrane glycosyltransferase